MEIINNTMAVIYHVWTLISQNCLLTTEELLFLRDNYYIFENVYNGQTLVWNLGITPLLDQMSNLGVFGYLGAGLLEIIKDVIGNVLYLIVQIIGAQSLPCVLAIPLAIVGTFGFIILGMQLIKRLTK